MFAHRKDGKIVSLTRWPQADLPQEELPDDHPEVLEFQAKLVDEQDKEKIIRTLAAIDVSSVRAIREYITKQPDAPQVLKDKEAQAAAERDKLGRA